MTYSYESIIKDGTLSVPSLDAQFDGTVSAFLSEKFKKYGNTLATVDTISGESFTYAELNQLSQNVVSALYRKGMRKGDLIVYMCSDIVKLHIFCMGVWKANGLVRALYSEELEDSIYGVMTEASANWILCEDTEAEKCLSVAQKLNATNAIEHNRVEVIVMQRNINGCTSIYDLFQDDGKACPQSEINSEDVAIIFSTSGTTGKPKGVMHTHKSVIRGIESLEFNVNFAERNLFLSKGAHLSAIILSFAPMSLGATVLTMSRLTAENTFHAVEKYKPGFIWGVSPSIRAIAQDERMENVDKSSIKYIATGGSALPSSLKSELQPKMKNLKFVTNVFGATETALCVMSSYRPSSDSEIVGFDVPSRAMGKVMSGVSMKIIDENGKVLGPNQEGEMCFKNECLISGNYKQEKATLEAFTSDGFFRSGDKGYYDEQGFVYFIGRQKELFKCGGNQIHPASIDAVIDKHPQVLEVCTVGVQGPLDEKIPRAFVVLKPGSTATADDILQYAHKNLSKYKYLVGGLHIVPSLPKGTTGKTTRLLVEKLPVPI